MIFKLENMSKKVKRGLLNQIIEETPEETTQEEVVESQPISIDAALLTPEPEMTLEEVVAQEEFIEEVPEIEEVPVEEIIEEPQVEEEIVEDLSYEEKLKRFLGDKSSSPYRLYLRTGILPNL